LVGAERGDAGLDETGRKGEDDDADDKGNDGFVGTEDSLEGKTTSDGMSQKGQQ
jgi:hypothetical protein